MGLCYDGESIRRLNELRGIMVHLNVHPAGREDLPILSHLYQLLLYDLSPTTGAELDATGRYAAPELDTWVMTSGIQPFLVYSAGKPAGFAVVSVPSRALPTAARITCSALFIVRKYRMQGHGREVATTLFDRFPGDWEVAAEAAYIPGHTFWRAVVDRYTGGRYTESWMQRPNFCGHVQRFTVPAVAVDTCARAVISVVQP